MKMPRLLLMLAALSAFVPAALAAIEERFPDMGTALRRRRPCPGCYTSLNQSPILEHMAEESLKPIPTLESSMALLEFIKEPPAQEHSMLLASALQTELDGSRVPLDISKVLLRTRREERKLASARRRGKQPGTRPVCRGCFSGLMLTGQPAQGGAAKGNLPNSLSESSENSSGGD